MSAYIAIHLQKQIREHFYECCAYCQTAEFLTANRWKQLLIIKLVDINLGVIVMNPFGGIVQKAFYLGLGLATVAGEKAGETLGELRTQASKLADELVERGEMTSDEAKKFVDDLVRNSQKPISESSPNSGDRNPSGQDAPRTIAIDDEENDPANKDVDELKNKVQALQDELRRLQK